jgi:hypothetical protein
MVGRVEGRVEGNVSQMTTNQNNQTIKQSNNHHQPPPTTTTNHHHHSPGSNPTGKESNSANLPTLSMSSSSFLSAFSNIRSNCLDCIDTLMCSNLFKSPAVVVKISSLLLAAAAVVVVAVVVVVVVVVAV